MPVHERMHVQTFIAKGPVEALDEWVFPRAAWRDVERLCSLFRQPVLKRLCDELRAIVATNVLGGLLGE